MATNEPAFLSKIGNGASLVSLICGRESTAINQNALFLRRAESAEISPPGLQRRRRPAAAQEKSCRKKRNPEWASV